MGIRVPKPAKSDLMNDYHLLSYDVLDSTNDEARRLAEGGGSHGAVIWARRQTAGRGRMGREWVSADGNLFVSMLLQPDKPLEECAQLSFVTALALLETLDGIAPNKSDLTCKWPNDVLYQGKKIAGILLESFTAMNQFGREVTWIIVGVGVNIDSYPEHVLFPAACLRDAGVEIISAKIVLSRFLSHFMAQYDAWAKRGFAPAQKAWAKRAYGIGCPVEVMIGDEQMNGVFEGIDAGGQLLLKKADGKRAAIVAGDVFFSEVLGSRC